MRKRVHYSYMYHIYSNTRQGWCSGSSTRQARMVAHRWQTHAVPLWLLGRPGLCMAVLGGCQLERGGAMWLHNIVGEAQGALHRGHSQSAPASVCREWSPGEDLCAVLLYYAPLSGLLGTIVGGVCVSHALVHCSSHPFWV